MPDWESDSPELRDNLKTLLRQIVHLSTMRETPTLEMAREWHRTMMKGLSAPDPRWVGAFRGEAGLEDIQVQVGPAFGSPARLVSDELSRFESTLQRSLRTLDLLLPTQTYPNLNQLSAILNLCAWVHAEWIRIHPVANGSGRIARLWVNYLATRYGLPPFMRMRPRPGAGYGKAAELAMKGDWKPTLEVFHQLFGQFVDDLSRPEGA